MYIYLFCFVFVEDNIGKAYLSISISIYVCISIELIRTGKFWLGKYASKTSPRSGEPALVYSI